MASKDLSVSREIALSVRQISDLLVQRYKNPRTRKRAALILGAPGIGKTDLVNQVAEQLGARVQQYIIDTMPKEDMTGIPMLHQPRNEQNIDVPGGSLLSYVKYSPVQKLLECSVEWTNEQRAIHNAKLVNMQAEGASPEDLAAVGEFQEPGPVIFFLDEMLNAPADVQAVYHKLLDDGGFSNGQYHLRDNVMIVAASNRKQDGAVVHKAGKPLEDRFMRLNVQPVVEDWLDWARRVGLYEPVIAFIKSRGASVLGLEGVDPKIALKQPSPRSWRWAAEDAAMDCYQISAGDSPETKAHKSMMLQAMIEGEVGPAAAIEFMKFMEFAREAPSAETIAEKWETLDIFQDKPDIAFVAIENMLSGVKKNAKWVRPFLKYAGRLHPEYRDMFRIEIMNVHGSYCDNKEILAEVFVDTENFDEIAGSVSRFHSVKEKANAEGSKLKRPRKQ